MLCGFLALRKPSGPSSAAVINTFKRLSGQKSVGHSGTLDPLADGVLVLALNRATILFPFLPTEKTYVAVIRLGQSTDSLDAQGTTTRERPVPLLARADWTPVLARFQGTHLQTPPMRSARHHEGQRLYRMARRGQHIEVPPNTITIHRLELIEYSAPDLTIEVTCSSGTYIRSLAHDLGEAVGCGAHLLKLRRTVSNGWSWDQALPLEQWSQLRGEATWLPYIIAPAEGLAHLPGLTLDADAADRVRHGRRIPRDPKAQAPRVRLLGPEGRLLAVACPAGAEWVLERVFETEPEEAACASSTV